MAKSPASPSQSQITPADAQKKKHRSPNYPGWSLPAALAKAETLYSSYKRHYVPMSTAITLLGYKDGSSVGQQMIATLLYFGLADDDGMGPKRQVRVSERAAKIIENHSDRSKLLQESALQPPIHREVWDRFHKGDDGLAPDATIKQYLRWDREGATFNPEALETFIELFKESIAFAGLDSSASISSDSAAKCDGAGADAMTEPNKVNTPTMRPPDPGTREFSFPLLDGVATLRVPHPMGPENYDLLTAVLAAMKSALVGQKKTENPS
jgi:hypothetical protein